MILPAAVWRETADAHRKRAEKHTLAARHRRDRGLPHPVADFLFEYYPFGFSLLEQWRPEVGIALVWDDAQQELSGRWKLLENGCWFTDPGLLTEKEQLRLRWIVELLESTRDRLPNFACHGLHEWAMVYRGKEVRHENTLKLRLPQEEINAVVESQAICCSHHDAFRFFASEARPLNHMQPTLESRVLLEQPGCLHANMDLYKWAAKTMPWCGSDLLLDCFELAVDLRNLDMRASPYDLSGWGLDAVRIETADGRRAYESEQKALASRARPLRDRLIEVIGKTLEIARIRRSELDVCESML